jgi:hypothetical protein
MIAFVALCALADPPRGEVVAGWAGNLHQGYGFAAYTPTLGRSEDASVVLRIAPSYLYYDYYDALGTTHVSSPGTSVGVGFRYYPSLVSFGLAVSADFRYTTTNVPGRSPEKGPEIGAAVSGDVYAPIGRRAVLYAAGSFSGANVYLWSRGGFKHQVLPAFKRHTWAQVWLGADVTARGNRDARALEVAALAEIPIRDWHAAFNLRGGLSVEDVGAGPHAAPTVGLGMYYSY